MYDPQVTRLWKCWSMNILGEGYSGRLEDLEWAHKSRQILVLRGPVKPCPVSQTEPGCRSTDGEVGQDLAGSGLLTLINMPSHMHCHLCSVFKNSNKSWNTFKTLITVWQQIILNPYFPTEDYKTGLICQLWSAVWGNSLQNIRQK